MRAPDISDHVDSASGRVYLVLGILVGLATAGTGVLYVRDPGKDSLTLFLGTGGAAVSLLLSWVVVRRQDRKKEAWKERRRVRRAEGDERP